MLELLAIIAVIVIIVIAVKMGKQNNKPAKSEKSDDELIADANRLILLMEVKRQAEENGDTATVKAVNNMTYNGPLPEKLPDGSYSSLYAKYLHCKIAGINYRKGIANYVGKCRGYIKPEPTNEHDPNAIAIYCAEDDHHLGYVPSDDTDDVRALGLSFPIPVQVEIEECYDDDMNDEGETVERRFYVGDIYIELPADYTPKK